MSYTKFIAIHGQCEENTTQASYWMLGSTFHNFISQQFKNTVSTLFTNKAHIHSVS